MALAEFEERHQHLVLAVGRGFTVAPGGAEFAQVSDADSSQLLKLLGLGPDEELAFEQGAIFSSGTL